MNCFDCYYSKGTRYRGCPQTLESPEEYPECDCNADISESKWAYICKKSGLVEREFLDIIPYDFFEKLPLYCNKYRYDG